MRPDDEHRLDRLWADWHRAVLAYALRRTDPASAEDAVSETFLVAWRRLERVPETPLPWLLAVARRVLANQRRGDRRRGALLERLRIQPAPAPVSPGLGDEALAEALAALGERDREALMLHAWDGLDNAAAGEVLGCSAGTYGVRLHRARRRLEAELARSAAAPPIEAPR